MSRRLLVAACAMLVGAAGHIPCASAQETATDAQGQIEELKRALTVRDQVIRNLITRIEQLERAVGDLRGGTAGAPAEQPPARAGAAQVGNEAQSTPGEQSATATPGAPAPARDDQQLIRAAFERTLIERGGLLLPRWTFELEPSMSYAHSSSENLVIDGFTIFPVLIVGDIFSERRRRNTLTTSLTARLGLPWKSQIELRAPYVYEDDSRLSGDGRESKISDRGWGDLELAFSRDLPRAFGRGPQLLGSMRWKIRTARDPFGLDEEEEIPFGSGFQSLTASLTGVSVVDPVVFFGTLSYTDSLSARKGANRIDPGDSLGMQLGMALALNLETSMSFAFEQSFTERTRVDGAEVPGTYVNTGTFSLGMSRSLPSGRSFDTSLAIGLSEDSPDLQLGFSMPFRK